jgi:hypothetical protein
MIGGPILGMAGFAIFVVGVVELDVVPAGRGMAA